MSDPQASQTDSQDNNDSRADLRAMLVIFAAAVLMAVHFASGFTFDF